MPTILGGFEVFCHPHTGDGWRSSFEHLDQGIEVTTRQTAYYITGPRLSAQLLTSVQIECELFNSTAFS
jgi:hypothetical protein